MGCGLIYETGEVFFTKNGKFLGVGYSNAQGKELFPSVGLHSSAEKVVFNLGKKPFKFNFEAGTDQPSFFDSPPPLCKGAHNFSLSLSLRGTQRSWSGPR